MSASLSRGQMAASLCRVAPGCARAGVVRGDVPCRKAGAERSPGQAVEPEEKTAKASRERLAGLGKLLDAT